MRIATIAAMEAGIQVCASVHDAFWIMAPSSEIGREIERMRDIMVRAGAAVTGGLPISVTVEEVVHWPQNLGDKRRVKSKGPNMWVEVHDLLDSGSVATGGSVRPCHGVPSCGLLVRTNPSDVFDDLSALRQEQRTPTPQRRARLTETFARIPHDRALQLYRHIGGPAWVLLVELDRLILAVGVVIRSSSPARGLRAAGLTRHARWRGLQQLEEAGVVRVERRGKGRSPWVLHLWFPRQD